MKSIHHYSQLPGFFCTKTFFNSARMWAMRNPCRMKGDHTAGYHFSAHKISVNIINQFITINIAVVIGHWNGQRMIIEKPGYKTAYDKIVSLKCDMYRRRLVYASCNGFEIQNRKYIRVTTAIPTHHIKRMMRIVYSIKHALLFNSHQKISALILCS